MILFIGKKFKIISQGTVSHAEIVDIEKKFAIVLIDGKKFKMDKEKLVNKFSEYELEEKSKSKSQCKNCMEYKNDNCFGSKSICSSYRPSPEISKDEMATWPKIGDASYYRIHKYF